MARTTKELMVENLLTSVALGLLAVVVASVTLIVRSSEVSREQAVLSDLAGRPVSSAPVAGADPHILRLYRVGGTGPVLYGASLSLDSPSGVAMVATILGADGQLQALKVYDATGIRSPFTRADWFSDYLGKGGAAPYPSSPAASRNPSAVSGASESYLLNSDVLTDLSERVRSLAKEGK